MQNTKRYLTDADNVDQYFEIVATHYIGAVPHRITGKGLDDYRARIADLRAAGFRPAKIGGGLDRVFRVLAG